MIVFTAASSVINDDFVEKKTCGMFSQKKKVLTEMDGNKKRGRGREEE